MTNPSVPARLVFSFNGLVRYPLARGDQGIDPTPKCCKSNVSIWNYHIASRNRKELRVRHARISQAVGASFSGMMFLETNLKCRHHFTLLLAIH
jgi:hypothetical protein